MAFRAPTVSPPWVARSQSEGSKPGISTSSARHYSNGITRYSHSSRNESTKIAGVRRSFGDQHVGDRADVGVGRAAEPVSGGDGGDPRRPTARPSGMASPCEAATSATRGPVVHPHGPDKSATLPSPTVWARLPHRAPGGGVVFVWIEQPDAQHVEAATDVEAGLLVHLAHSCLWIAVTWKRAVVRRSIRKRGHQAFA
jgi:hypothetical protein